jgi:hypothetical protein
MEGCRGKMAAGDFPYIEAEAAVRMNIVPLNIKLSRIQVEKGTLQRGLSKKRTV